MLTCLEKIHAKLEKIQLCKCIKRKSSSTNYDDGKSAIINFDIAKRKKKIRWMPKTKYKFRPNQTANDKLISYFIKLHDVCAWLLPCLPELCRDKMYWWANRWDTSTYHDVYVVCVHVMSFPLHVIIFGKKFLWICLIYLSWFRFSSSRNTQHKWVSE